MNTKVKARIINAIINSSIALSAFAGAYFLIDNPYIFGGIFLMQFGNNLTQQKG